jgi:hypothetical protein
VQLTDGASVVFNRRSNKNNNRRADTGKRNFSKNIWPYLRELYYIVVTGKKMKSGRQF